MVFLYFSHRDCQREVENLKEQTAMFMEMISAKDEIIISLTNRVRQNLTNMDQLIFVYRVCYDSI